MPYYRHERQVAAPKSWLEWLLCDARRHSPPLQRHRIGWPGCLRGHACHPWRPMMYAVQGQESTIWRLAMHESRPPRLVF